MFSDLDDSVPSPVLRKSQIRTFNLLSDIELKISPFQLLKLRVRLNQGCASRQPPADAADFASHYFEMFTRYEGSKRLM